MRKDGRSVSRAHTTEGRDDRPSGRGPAEAVPRRVEADALADPTRYRLFQQLADATGPLGIVELTDAAGVHHTVVRQHIAKLRDAGLVVETTATPRGRGRPRLLYAVDPAVARRGQEADHYQRLAGLLAEAVRRGEGARDTGRRTGAAAARQWAGARVGNIPVASEIVVAESERMGFEPTLEVMDATLTDVVLHHCPFRDVAADDPETVCSLHLGIAEGVVDEVGGAEVEGMTVRDPYRAGCRLHLSALDGTPPPQR